MTPRGRRYETRLDSTPAHLGLLFYPRDEADCAVRRRVHPDTSWPASDAVRPCRERLRHVQHMVIWDMFHGNA